MATRTYLTDEQVKAMNFTQVREALDEKRKNLAEVFRDRDVHEIPAEEASQIKHQNDELTLLAERYDALSELNDVKGITDNLTRYLRQPVTALPVPDGDEKPREGFKDAGLLFVQSEAFKAAAAGDYMRPMEVPITSLYPEMKGIDFDADLSGVKGVLGTDDSLTGVDNEYPIQNIRLPGIIGPVGERQLRIENLFPSSGMSGNAIPYMEETTTTNSAAETEEGAAKPESALGFEEKSSPAQVVATWLPITRQLLSDQPAMRGYVNGRLRYFVDSRVDTQLVTGNGTAPNLRGILNVSGIQTQAKSTDPTPDAVYKAMTKVRGAATGYFVEPDAAVFHPNDWQDIRLLRTADGIYIWGSPAESGPERIWGLGVVQTTALTENTGLVGAFRFGGMIFNRWGLTLRVAEQHSDDFTKNKVTILAERRLAFPVFRPAAFCTVTGI